MNTHTSLTNALESDFRAIASRTRVAEMKRLWRALWKMSPGVELHAVAPFNKSESTASNSESTARCTPAAGTEQLPKAA